MAIKFNCPVCGTEKIVYIAKRGEKVQCDHCKAKIIVPDDAVEIKKIEKEEKNLNKYPTLILITRIYVFLAVIVGIATLFGIGYGIYLIVDYEKVTGTTILVCSLIGGFIGVITFLAISEIIKLFIDIECNTRNIINRKTAKK